MKNLKNYVNLDIVFQGVCDRERCNGSLGLIMRLPWTEEMQILGLLYYEYIFEATFYVKTFEADMALLHV